MFDEIPEEYPKFGFSFINYLMSSAMILISIVTKNPGFKENYRGPVISAVHSLSRYCRKTWLSGKTIRMISKLNSMVRSTFDQSIGKSYEHVATRHGHRLGLGNQTPRTAIHPSLSLAATAGSEQPGASSAPVQSAPSHGPIALAQGYSTNHVEALPQRTDSPNEINRMGDCFPTGDGFFQPALLWPSNSPNSGFPDLPSWVMNDFDFEQAFRSNDRLRSTNYTAPNLLALNDELMQSMGDEMQFR